MTAEKWRESAYIYKTMSGKWIVIDEGIKREFATEQEARNYLDKKYPK